MLSLLNKILPDRKAWILVIIILSLLSPIQYLLHIYFPPEGYIFSGYGGDDSVFFNTMASPNFNLEDPWGEGSVLTNPAFGPVYLFLPLGYISLLTGLSKMVLFLILDFISSFIFLLASYHFFKHLTKRYELVYFIFILTLGVGGLFIFLYKIFTFSNLFSITPLYGFGTGVIRFLGAYQILPLATALLGIMYFIRNRFILSGFLLGITFLIYPFYGVASFIIIFLHFFVYRNSLRGLIYNIIILMVFSIPWLISYSISSSRFASYAEVGQSIGGIFLPTVLLGWGIPFLFSLYILIKRSGFNKNRLLQIILWVISIGLFSLSNLSRSFWVSANHSVNSFLLSLGILDFLVVIKPYALLLQIPLLLLIIIYSIRLYSDIRDQKERFVFLWFFVFVLIALAPTELLYSLGGKISLFVWVPISILGVQGIVLFSKNFRISLRFVVLIVFLLSLPSIVLMNMYSQTGPRERISSNNLENCCSYYSIYDTEVMNFLLTQPEGRVLSSVEIGTWLPSYSHKKSLFHLYFSNFVSNSKEKLEDYKRFYSLGASDKERIDILNKYKISYVFFGDHEQKITGNSNLFGNKSYLEKIFDSGSTFLYRVSV